MNGTKAVRPTLDLDDMKAGRTWKLAVGRWWITVWILCGTGLSLGEETLPVLKTKTGTYSNVTVTLKTSRDVHIRHDKGIGNVGVAELDDETKALLGYQVTKAGDGGTNQPAVIAAREWLSAIQRAGDNMMVDEEMNLTMPVTLDSTFLMIAVGFALIVHLVFSYCSRLICVKTGNAPGVMIWLPVLQIIPMLRAAGMSAWWFLAMLVPVVNLVVQIVWCFKIVSAREKHVIWAILLILPLFNVVAFLYLAFSNGDNREGVRFPAFSPA